MDMKIKYFRWVPELIIHTHLEVWIKLIFIQKIDYLLFSYGRIDFLRMQSVDSYGWKQFLEKILYPQTTGFVMHTSPIRIIKRDLILQN